ncbi:hypothetical protein [Streptomyces sp. V4I8]|uniref:hypothetical protein n=1 Tax=Streptomyces sp. V4I8 TaxID=3156469 RepID=UPI0035113E25
MPVRDDVIRVLDTTSRRWASVWLGEDSLWHALTLGPNGDELLLIGVHHTRIVSWAALRGRFTARDERPPRHRRADRRWLPRRRPVPELPVTHVYETPGSAEFAAMLPGGDAYAVAGHTTLTVVGTYDGEVHRSLDLPSPCTALTAGPAGELVVGARNGPILFE